MKTYLQSGIIIGFAIMLSIPAVNSAFGAQKTNEINDTIIFEDSGLEFCGEDNVSEINVLTIKITEWDNNMLKFHFTSRAIWTDDDTGKVIAVATSTNDLERSESELPVSLQQNMMGHCTGNESFGNQHFGLTIQKDGTVVFRGDP